LSPGLPLDPLDRRGRHSREETVSHYGLQLFPGVFGRLRISKPDWLPHLREEGSEKSEE